MAALQNKHQTTGRTELWEKACAMCVAFFFVTLMTVIMLKALNHV